MVLIATDRYVRLHKVGPGDDHHSDTFKSSSLLTPAVLIAKAILVLVLDELSIKLQAIRQKDV
jgi:hypothetical protein